jgi:hypothetical protein
VLQPGLLVRLKSLQLIFERLGSRTLAATPGEPGPFGLRSSDAIRRLA